MRKRVFGSIFLTALVTLLITTGLLLAAIHSSMSEDVRTRLRQECTAAAQLVQDEGKTALENVGDVSADRITLIAEDGSVIYDNRSDQESMDNHRGRPEVEQAMKTGVGQTSRLSDTVSEQTYYYALLLEDGSVLRMAATSDSAFGALKDASLWIVWVLLIAMLVALLLAGRLTDLFVTPIVSLDLKKPLENDVYDELSPLLHRLAKQNRKIEMQLKELGRRQAEFGDITEGMDEGLVLFAESGDIVFANRAVRAMFPQDSADGSYLALCRDPAYIHAVESALRGESTHGRMERDGRVYELTASSVAGKGQSHAAVLFFVEVTDRERAEQQRQEFTANVSHELKTPLTSIMGYAEIIENGIVRPEDVRPFAGKIRAEAKRLLTLIEDIIRLSHLDEGGEPSPPEAVDLLTLCGTVKNRLQGKADGLGIALRAEGEKAVVSGHARTLEQMIFNLADNAIVYNKPDGSVVLSAGAENGAPFVRVADTGIGIAPAEQMRVFERFYRVDKSHSKMTGGTGLGLSIVKHGAALHNAVISMDSTLDVGTTITIRFPQGQ